MTDLGFIHHYVPPKNADATVLVLLHGTGGNENDLIPIGRSLLPDAGMLSLRGKVLENGMPRFFRRFAEGVFDLEDLALRTNELNQFLEDARKHYGLTGKRFIAIGYSNGANIASSLMFSHPEQLAGAILFRAMVTVEPVASPDLSRVSILLSEGERDPIVPKENAERLAKMFRLAGTRLQLHWHKGGHELGQDDLDTARLWLTGGLPTR
jgi:predicted esterase